MVVTCLAIFLSVSLLLYFSIKLAEVKMPLKGVLNSCETIEMNFVCMTLSSFSLAKAKFALLSEMILYLIYSFSFKLDLSSFETIFLNWVVCCSTSNSRFRFLSLMSCSFCFLTLISEISALA